MNKKSMFIGFLGVILICLITTGCLFYNLLNAKEFKKYFEKLGYTISVNNESKYESSKTSYIAKKSGINYKMEYYEFNNEVDAKKAYQTFKKNVSDYITDEAKINETTGAVFSKLIVESNNEYIIYSRVKNTIIWITGTPNDKNDITNVLKDIRY